MSTLISYALVTVLTVDLLATSGDITMTWSSPILTKLHSNVSDVNPFGQPITDDEESWIGSLINIGAMVGPFPYGYLSAKFGRKISLLCIAIPHIFSYLTFAFSKSVYLYYFGRILGGVAVGGGYTLLPMYVAEISKDSNRGKFSSTLNIFWTLGALIPYALGPPMPIQSFNIFLACIPTSFFVLFLIIAPESPYYLTMNNEIDKAEKTLLKLRSADKKAVENEISLIQNELLKNCDTITFREFLNTKTYMKGLFISLVLIIGQQLSGVNAVGFYTEEIFNAAGVTSIKPETSVLIIGLVIFGTSFLTPFIIDRLGRRILLLISTMGLTVANVSLGTYFFLQNSTSISVQPIWCLPITSMIFSSILFTVGLGPLPWTISSELFPTNVKSYTSTLVSCACWTTSFIVTKFFNDLQNLITEGGTFLLFGSFCCLTFLFTLVFVPETKEKSFQEIQEILEEKRK